MTRILLADDSPHAQRMGERILREEGFEVVTVTDGNTALLRLSDVDPDIVFADASLPRKSGYEICREIKSRPRHRHVRVILTAGLLEPFDDSQAKSVGCDAVLKKPFEASAVVETLKPLVQAAAADREKRPPVPAMPMGASVNSVVPVRVVTNPESLAPPASMSPPSVRPAGAASLPRPAAAPPPPVTPPQTPAATPAPAPQSPADIDVERVRAAVTLALDAALPAMIDKITEQVLVALRH